MQEMDKMTLLDKIRDGLDTLSESRKKRDEREIRDLQEEVDLLKKKVALKNRKKVLEDEKQLLEMKLNDELKIRY